MRPQKTSLGFERGFDLPSYIPELDGLRGIAIIAVVLFHLGAPGFSLGWTGVNLFFVISGFLITGILLDTKDGPHYFRNFYARRMLRIFPIYYLTLTAIVLYALKSGESVDDLPYYLFYGQNYVLSRHGWGADFPSLFDHTWSLAVEEQFYLFWPLVVVTLTRRHLIRLLAALFVVALLTRAFSFFVLKNPVLLYTPLPSQFDGLATGAFIALITRTVEPLTLIRKKARLVFLCSGLGLMLLVWRSGLNSYWTPTAWGTNPENLILFTLLALFFGSLLVLALSGGNTLSNALRSAELRHIGEISYGLYLYHYPIFLLMDTWASRLFPGSQSFVLRIIVALAKLLLTYATALASWHLLETRLKSLKRHFV
ncbi:MAG: acyltransferase [Pyrinomonadaceae bacterium]|nr:acyltransferase [Pyrinomonadaceae bacterium]